MRSIRGGLPYSPYPTPPVRVRASEGEAAWAWSVRRTEILPFPRLFGGTGAQQQRRRLPRCMTFYASTLSSLRVTHHTKTESFHSL